jgi:putative ABC transport system permease protein
MSVAFKELLRQPRRFLPVGVALTLLVVLLIVLGGFLDGLELSQTGAYRAQDGLVLVLDDEADRQIQRSRVTADQAEAIDRIEQVAAVGAFDQTFTVAATGDGELFDITLVGYDLATEVLPVPPAGGEAVVDAQLGQVAGIGVGDTLAIGPTGEPVTVAALVDDLTQVAPSVWVGADAWRSLLQVGNPAALPPAGSSQALVVRPADGWSEGEVIVAISGTATASGGGLIDGVEAVTPTEAIAALDVVQQQSSTFAGIIGVTFVVTLLVVALFFALITLERVRLYAVLKALGAGNGELLRGVSVQALGISAVAVVVGLAVSVAFISFLPPELPIRVEGIRLAQIVVGTLVTSVIGSLSTARRILRVDPAEAIG